MAIYASPGGDRGFALFVTVPVWAQHGGGHGGGGHSGGFSGHSGFSGGSHFSGGRMRSAPSAAHSYSHAPSFTQRSFAPSQRNSSQRASNRPFLHGGFRGSRYGNYGFRNNCYGYPCRGGYGYGYPWAYSGFYDPYWWWDSGSSYDDDYNNNLGIANDMNEQSLEEQQMLRQEEADRDQDVYARSSRMADPPASAQQGSPILPPTVLVYRDQHRQEVQNYAIVGQTLWNFTAHHTEKIPLADLDLAATAKANDEQGITFRVPAMGEAQ